MKFTLKTCGSRYNNEEKEKLEKIGFHFEPSHTMFGAQMWRKVTKPNEIDFSTVEEIAAFAAEWDGIIVDSGSITIYDDYNG